MKTKKSRDPEQINQKHKILDAFWKEVAQNNAQSRNPDVCEWCERFRPLNFRVCMNCGTELGGVGFFE